MLIIPCVTGLAEPRIPTGNGHALLGAAAIGRPCKETHTPPCAAKLRAKERKESKPAQRKEPSAAPRARRVHRGALTDLSGWGSLARQNDFGHTELWQNSVLSERPALRPAELFVFVI